MPHGNLLGVKILMIYFLWEAVIELINFTDLYSMCLLFYSSWLYSNINIFFQQ